MKTTTLITMPVSDELKMYRRQKLSERIVVAVVPVARRVPSSASTRVALVQVDPKSTHRTLVTRP